MSEAARPSKRIVFTFDWQTVEALTRVQGRLGCRSLAEAVRASVRVMDSLQEQAVEGFRTIQVANPKTGDVRVMASAVIPK